MAADSSTGGHTGLTTKVELSFSCTKLLDMDVFSKSDPFLVLYTSTGYTSWSNSGWVKLGRTEVIYDNLNPKVSLQNAIFDMLSSVYSRYIILIFLVFKNICCGLSF